MFDNMNGNSPLVCTSKVFKLDPRDGFQPNYLSFDWSKAPALFELPSQLDIRMPRETLISDAFGNLWLERFRDLDSLFTRYFVAASAICCNGPLGRRYATISQFIESAMVSLPELGNFKVAFIEKARSTSFVVDARKHYMSTIRKVKAWCSCRWCHTAKQSHRLNCGTIAMWDTIFQISILLGELFFDEGLDATWSGIQFTFSDALSHMSSIPCLSQSGQHAQLPLGIAMYA